MRKGVEIDLEQTSGQAQAGCGRLEEGIHIYIDANLQSPFDPPALLLLPPQPPSTHARSCACLLWQELIPSPLRVVCGRGVGGKGGGGLAGRGGCCAACVS
jgi:hypothetical protein